MAERSPGFFALLWNMRFVRELATTRHGGDRENIFDCRRSACRLTDGNNRRGRTKLPVLPEEFTRSGRLQIQQLSTVPGIGVGNRRDLCPQLRAAALKRLSVLHIDS